MIRRTLLSAFLGAALAVPTSAQTRLSLNDAIARARSEHVDALLAEQGAASAATRVDEAQAPYWPTLDVSEGWQRGDQPVFVFGSLLAQRRFTEADFAIDALNHPSPINNHRAAVMAQQLFWDGGAREATLRAARLGERVALVEQDRVAADLGIRVTQAYGGVLQAAAASRAAVAAIEAARADLSRARDRRDAGLVTEADVLAIEVHVARMEEQRIQAVADERVARIRLNEAIGAPLDAEFVLDAAPPSPASAVEEPAVEAGLADRPDVRSAVLAEQLADASADASRAGFLPVITGTAGWEWNGASFDRRASSWLVGAEVRWNLFRGGADRARRTRAALATERAALERRRVETNARVNIAAARARLEAARAREAAGEATVNQARESERIIRDRYENGLADVTSLLRAAESVLASEAQVTSARVEVMVGTAELLRALGQGRGIR